LAEKQGGVFLYSEFEDFLPHPLSHNILLSPEECDLDASEQLGVGLIDGIL
jgi:hypothetical protein